VESSRTQAREKLETFKGALEADLHIIKDIDEEVEVPATSGGQGARGAQYDTPNPRIAEVGAQESEHGRSPNASANDRKTGKDQAGM
jgi:hypothetical protein